MRLTGAGLRLHCRGVKVVESRRGTLKETIVKSDWLAAEQCLGMAWHGLRAGSTAPNEAELFRKEQGLEIGRRARELYPNGIVVANRDGKSSAGITHDPQNVRVVLQCPSTNLHPHPLRLSSLSALKPSLPLLSHARDFSPKAHRFAERGRS